KSAMHEGLLISGSQVRVLVRPPIVSIYLSMGGTSSGQLAAAVAEPSFARGRRFTFLLARKKRCRSPRYHRRTGAGPRPSCAVDMAACPTAPPAPGPPGARSGAGH